MEKKLFTAIAFFPPNLERSPAKYRNISNRNSFTKFARREGFLYVNWYDKHTRQYLERQYL
jgi:hypothetical protein